MFKSLAAALALCAIALPAAAEPRALSGFDSVEAGGPVLVEVALGQGFSVDVDGPRAADVETTVNGDRLSIRMRRGFRWRDGHAATIRVTMPSVSALSAGGGSDLRTSGLRAEQLALSASGGADLNATDVEAAQLRLSASGGADLVVSGTCGTLAASASGGADLRARGLRCTDASVSASGGSDATIHATGAVDVSGSGGSDVRVLGEPRLGNVALSSGSDLHH